MRFVLLVTLTLCTTAAMAEPPTRSPIQPLLQKALGPGDLGYKHDLYREVYDGLKKFVDGNWKSCCNGGECRVTKALLPADSEGASKGYDTRVFVDGQYCPIKLSQVQIRLTKEQAVRIRKDPSFGSFLFETHVCAAPRRSREEVCPTIYCIVDGGGKG